MRKYKTTNKPMSSINVVPYIDVMLVLLIIFMVTTPLITQGVHVNLPKTNTGEIDAAVSKPLIITINKSGEIFLNNNENQINSDKLLLQIKNKLNINPKIPVFIRGDTDTKYGDIIKIMGQLKQSGVTEIGIITQTDKQS